MVLVFLYGSRTGINEDLQEQQGDDEFSWKIMF